MIYNRRKLFNMLEVEVEKANRYCRPLSLLLIDLDYFKEVNDKYGHNIGDIVLKTTTQIVADAIRKVDIFARFGGEEFVIICPETDIDGAVSLAEKIRAAVQQHSYPMVGNITISAGVSELFRTRIHQYPHQEGRRCSLFGKEERQEPGGSTKYLLNSHIIENFLCDSEAIEGSGYPAIDCSLNKHFGYLFLGKTIVDCAANMQLEFMRPVQRRYHGEIQKTSGSAVDSRPSPYLSPAILRYEFLQRHCELVCIPDRSIYAVGTEYFPSKLESLIKQFAIHHFSFH